MRDLNGRNAVIVGGGSGIGRGIALALAAEGVNILVADRDLPAAQAVTGELAALGATAHAAPADVTDEASLAELARTAERLLGPVHVLVNNAGIALMKPIEAASAEDWHAIMGVNLYGAVNGCRAFLPGMKAHGEPAVVLNTASVAAFMLLRVIGMGPYNVSKAAILAYTDSLRIELAETAIECVALAPGEVATNLGTNTARFLAEKDLPPSQPTVPNSAAARARSQGRPPLGNAQMERMSAEECGQIAVRGLKEGRRLIFTHPRYRENVARRFNAWLDDIDTEAAAQAG